MAFGDAGRAFGYAVRRHRISATVLGLALTLTLVVSLLPKGQAGAATSGPPAALTPSVGAYLGARVEQRGSESLLQAIQRVEGQIGRTFAIDHFYYQWTSSFPNSSVAASVAGGRIPLINWKSGSSWSAIASGSQDATIAARADAIKAAGYPIYLAYHHEPENDLDSYGTPQQYAAAFRRIVEVFRSRGVTNVGFVWNMMAWSFDPRSGRDPNAFYPGDAYVDFVGADGYNWHPVRSGDSYWPFRDIFTRVNDWAIAHGKPWMICEFGSVEDPANPNQKPNWIREALAGAKIWPALKALVYFDVNKVPYDWRTDTSTAAMAAYREIAQDPYLTPPTGPVTQPPAPSPSPTPPPAPSPSPTQPPAPSPSPTQPPAPSPSPPQPPVVSPTIPGTFANNLDGGPLGASLESNYGASGGDGFDGVAIGESSSLVYDDTHTHGVGLSARHTVGWRQNAYYKWGSSLDDWNALFGRVYVWFDALPSGDLRMIRGKDGSELSFAIDILDDGRLRAQDRSNETIAQTSTSIITGGWVRIEWRVDVVAGQIDLLIFNSPDSSTPTDWATSGPGRTIGNAGGGVHIGRSGSQPFSAVFWTDDPAVSTGGFLGPTP